MENVVNTIEFALARINTEQFAIIEEGFREGTPVALNTNLRYGIDRANRVVAVYSLFQFEQERIPFLKVELLMQFAIAEKSWQPFLRDEVTTIIPKGFLAHLAMITVGTARGVLHAKTEGTRFNEFVLPTINVAEMVKEDGVFVEPVPASAKR
ncbi:MAG: hypothetical protein ACK5SK_12055 [Cyclobacteriaceae bacterium]|jgi:hypothetical protein